MKDTNNTKKLWLSVKLNQGSLIEQRLGADLALDIAESIRCGYGFKYDQEDGQICYPQNTISWVTLREKSWKDGEQEPEDH